MHPNHAFAIAFARRERPGGRYLDFGCGAGDTVAADEHVWGCDDFSLNARPDHPRVQAIAGGRIPFPDGHFDVVFSNMVFEHVHDLAGVLAELKRVLKPDGVMLHLFPTLEVWREGHCGVPFAHRIRRRWYLAAWRRLGVGVEKWRTPWVDYWMNYLQTAVAYRPRKAVAALFEAAGFAVEAGEQQYLQYRLGRTVPVLGPYLLRRLAFMVIIARPR